MSIIANRLEVVSRGIGCLQISVMRRSTTTLCIGFFCKLGTGTWVKYVCALALSRTTLPLRALPIFYLSFHFNFECHSFLVCIFKIEQYDMAQRKLYL